MPAVGRLFAGPSVLGLTLLVSGTDSAAATLARSLPLHQLHALGSFMKRGPEERWAYVQTAKIATCQCEHNSDSWDLLITDKLTKAPGLDGMRSFSAAGRGACSSSSGSRTSAPNRTMATVSSDSGFRDLTVELQAASLDLAILMWRIEAQPGHRPGAVAGFGDRLQAKHLRPVSVAFREDGGGRRFLTGLQPLPPSTPMVTSLLALRCLPPDLPAAPGL
eukprot:CAMPEP_0171098718 /NCGR_PEP_ID=MMETSP0766_2-20121228/49197_1 /TAXON_ID=439317 /ORGANISM="Gambierdiscus australes, Strain CAWD 149" /LENGTH=219 /DNA_ID=CAMNT_0011558133 /DNA_START=38 /DNA_END=697 /DNA_ORIENTATION=+